MKVSKLFIIATCMLLAVPSNAQSLYHIKSMIEKGEYRLAAEELRPLAEKGNAEAQYLAACLFMEGKGVIKSEEQAEKYFTLAAHGGNEQAAIKLVERYEDAKQQEKVAQLLTKMYESDNLPSVLAHKYGIYLYCGYGNMTVDKHKGWALMCNSKVEIETDIRKDFYTSIINEGKESPEYMLYLICDYYWSYSNSRKDWTTNYLDDAIMVVKSSKKEDQIACARLCDSLITANKSEAASVVLAMMYAEGIGIEKDFDKAKQCYSSAVDDNVYEMLFQNLFKNSDDGSDGHMKRNDFPDFWNVVFKDYKERQKRWDYTRNLKNVKLSCSAPCFKLKSVDAWICSDGDLAVRFEVFNTSPNPSGRYTRAYDARAKSRGKYHSASLKYDISTGSTVGIKGHATTYFTVYVSSNLLPQDSQVIESVYFTFESDYGKGYISADNVTWM